MAQLLAPGHSAASEPPGSQSEEEHGLWDQERLRLPGDGSFLS